MDSINPSASDYEYHSDDDCLLLFYLCKEVHYNSSLWTCVVSWENSFTSRKNGCDYYYPWEIPLPSPRAWTKAGKRTSHLRQPRTLLPTGTLWALSVSSTLNHNAVPGMGARIPHLRTCNTLSANARKTPSFRLSPLPPRSNVFTIKCLVKR